MREIISFQAKELGKEESLKLYIFIGWTLPPKSDVQCNWTRQQSLAKAKNTLKQGPEEKEKTPKTKERSEDHEEEKVTFWAAINRNLNKK